MMSLVHETRVRRTKFNPWTYYKFIYLSYILILFILITYKEFTWLNIVSSGWTKKRVFGQWTYECLKLFDIGLQKISLRKYNDLLQLINAVAAGLYLLCILILSAKIRQQSVERVYYCCLYIPFGEVQTADCWECFTANPMSVSKESHG